MTIQKEGFRTVVQPSLQLYVQDAVNQNFTLALGLTSDSITVVGSGLQTDSAAVSTVVDQQFVENMPLNGRSFQSLISLTPGVVYVSGNGGAGEFSVNGQRSDANYFMVDGVSANFGSTPQPAIGTTTGGTYPGLTSGGGTNALVSVDAMQEFRIQTSSYAPEFGRSPGAQVSIVTKSGANRFHGTAFDYLRNDIFDARNWFDFAQPNAYYGNPRRFPSPRCARMISAGRSAVPSSKTKLSSSFLTKGCGCGCRRRPQACSIRRPPGPRLRRPISRLSMRCRFRLRSALTDPTCDNITNPCLAPISTAYSNPASLNATSLRVDHNLTNKVTLFARYNYAPSYDGSRQWEELWTTSSKVETFTGGATILFTPTKVNDFRGNWSRNQVSDSHLPYQLSWCRGAARLSSVPRVPLQARSRSGPRLLSRRP